MRKVYDSQSDAYVSSCGTRDLDSTSASIVSVIDFLTSHVENKSINMIHGYAATIASHDPIHQLLL